MEIRGSDGVARKSRFKCNSGEEGGGELSGGMGVG